MWEATEDLGIVLLLPTCELAVALKGEDSVWLDTGSRAILPPAERSCMFRERILNTVAHLPI